jgi:hypothetical protein
VAGKMQLREGGRIRATIPLRPFGKHQGVQISALGMGGHHLGDAEDELTAIRLVQEAVDGGSRSSTTVGNIIAERVRPGWERVLSAGEKKSF